MDPTDVQYDTENFPQMDPAVAAKAAAAREAEAKKVAARNKKATTKKPTAAEVAQVAKLADAKKEQDNTLHKVQLIRRIQRYMKRFPEKLHDVKVPRGFGTKTPYEDVVMLHAECEQALHSGGSGEMLFAGLGLAVGFAQDIALSRGYTKLSGPRADLRGTLMHQRDQLMDTLDELAIKYEHWLATGPEKRLAMSLFMMTFMVIRANGVAEDVEQHAEDPLTDELRRDYMEAMQARPQ